MKLTIINKFHDKVTKELHQVGETIEIKDKERAKRLISFGVAKAVSQEAAKETGTNKTDEPKPGSEEKIEENDQ